MGSAKKNIRTPLHLLHELADSLIISLEKACTKAQAESEKALLTLDKKIQKIQKKYLKAKEKSQIAIRSDKTKSIKKAQKIIAKLDKIYAKLVSDKEEVQLYLAKLKKDAIKSLALAKGIIKVKEKAANLISNGEPDRKQVIHKKIEEAKSSISVTSKVPIKKTGIKKELAANLQKTETIDTVPKQITTNTTKRPPIVKKVKLASTNASSRKSQSPSKPQ